MQSTIEDLYYGKIHPWEQLNADKDKLAAAYDEIVKIQNSLKNKLSPELMSELESMLKKESNITTIEIEQTFVNGFKLGARLMMEVLA